MAFVNWSDSVVVDRMASVLPSLNMRKEALSEVGQHVWYFLKHEQDQSSAGSHGYYRYILYKYINTLHFLSVSSLWI